MNRLKELREDRDLSQTDLARILNMSQPGYSKYEVGTRSIPIDILEKLADFYDANIDYILYRTDIRDKLPMSIMYEKKTKTQKKH